MDNPGGVRSQVAKSGKEKDPLPASLAGLRRLEREMAAGRAPSPARLARLQEQARQLLERCRPSPQAGPAGQEAWSRACELAQGLACLRLDLARRFGPAWLELPLPNTARTES